MATQLRSSYWKVTGPASSSGHGATAGAGGWVRLVQALLAIYLLPALLIVLAVGGVGLLVLAVVRIVARVVHGPARTPIVEGPALSGVEEHDRRS